MKKRLLIAGLLFLAALLTGCGSGEEQPKEGSAEVVKSAGATDMPPEEMAKRYKELGIDPNHPPTNRGGNNR